MKIAIIGGGPAGLLFALLMKRHDASHDIRIIERDAAGATYGWGVVFSDVALAFVRDVAADLHASLTDGQEVHPAMQIVHRGQSVLLPNNVFHRMARIDLLRTLHRYCGQAGVRIEFGRRLATRADVESLSECGLIVGADGINSTVRGLYQEHFRPTLDVRPNKLAWYGTEQPFNPLSLIFRACPAGVLIAHAYRYGKNASTFLVECDPETWDNAGLARMSEADSLAYCEDVFRDHLGGHRLRSNRSTWFNYTIVSNRAWSWRNIVLLGDALRTGHPSIGSGTRLAMQDSIALYNAFNTCRGDVPAALREFERIRRPGSDELQAAAVKSTEWYEAIRSKMHLDPISFAYDYMTRTGRVSRDDLRKRDPELVAAWEALHGAAPGPSQTASQ